MIATKFPTTKIPQSQLQILVRQFEEGMQFARGTTRHVYAKALDQLLLYAKSSVFGFTPDDFVQFRVWLLNQRNLSTNTVNTYLTASRRFCEFLVEMGVLQKNPAWSVHGSAQEFKILGIGLTEVTKAISRVDRTTVLGKRDYAFLVTIIECGAAIHELINADIGDLKRNINRVELCVKANGTKGKYEALPISEAAAASLYEYIDSRGIVAADEPLFSTVRAGRAQKVRLSFRGVRAAMRKRLRVDDKRILRLDSLRTYCAVRLMKQGKTSDEIRSFMRFKSGMPFRRIMTNSKAIIETR
ncbi:MAG: tyrosine-type recombinase/integrase [Bacteroidetes bacterium]|nr:tyrosine-type recombinase/integrase [Bacteroidota bacterium]